MSIVSEHLDTQADEIAFEIYDIVDNRLPVEDLIDKVLELMQQAYMAGFNDGCRTRS